MKPDFSKIATATAGKTRTTGISPFSELELSKVYPNPNQPRKQFENIEELAATIKEHGLLQPISVVKKEDGYMIVSGERRYRAHIFNGAKTIKAHIISTSDEKIEELTLIENIQRNDLTDFETAKHIVRLWKSRRYDKKSDLAKKLGKSDSYISKAFSSLKLNDEILEDIEQNKKDIPLSVMDEISRLKDIEIQKEVYEKYSDGKITRDEIKEFKEPKKYKLEELLGNTNNTLEAFEKADNDLIEEAKIFNKEFPAGNLEANFKADNLEEDEQLATKNTVKTFEKIIDYGVVDDFDNSLFFENIEAGFYFVQCREDEPTFDKSKKYKITIEEI